MNPDAALDFLEFVSARHEAWQARQQGLPQPWTDNDIVNSRKFTNVFRVLDYGSQFVLTDLLDPEVTDADILMRLFLYRHTGRVEVWRYMRRELGYYPLLEDLEMVRAVFKEYRGEAGRALFTNAYLVYPQSSVPGTDKLDSIIDLTKRLFLEGYSGWVRTFLHPNSTQEERFNSLRQHKGVADFMSMQILTDWGYYTEFREDEFVKAGPGAIKGSNALGIIRASEGIEWALSAIRSLGEVYLDGREPSYMDAQNCLCEFSKYVRYQERPTPAKLYTPAHPGSLSYQLPRHW